MIHHLVSYKHQPPQYGIKLLTKETAMNAIEIIKSRLPGGTKAQAELVYDQHATTPQLGGGLNRLTANPKH